VVEAELVEVEQAVEAERVREAVGMAVVGPARVGLVVGAEQVREAVGMAVVGPAQVGLVVGAERVRAVGMAVVGPARVGLVVEAEQEPAEVLVAGRAEVDLGVAAEGRESAVEQELRGRKAARPQENG
jgi:hypothetical protein